jgi:hypothetical protein
MEPSLRQLRSGPWHTRCPRKPLGPCGGHRRDLQIPWLRHRATPLRAPRRGVSVTGAPGAGCHRRDGTAANQVSWLCTNPLASAPPRPTARENFGKCPFPSNGTCSRLTGEHARASVYATALRATIRCVLATFRWENRLICALYRRAP